MGRRGLVCAVYRADSHPLPLSTLASRAAMWCWGLSTSSSHQCQSVARGMGCGKVKAQIDLVEVLALGLVGEKLVVVDRQAEQPSQIV